METFLDLPQKSLAIYGYLWRSSVTFRNFWNMFGNIRVWKRSGKYWRIFRNLRKVVRNLRKIIKASLSVCLDIIINKNNNTWLLVNIEYLFLCSTLYCTRSLHSLVGYRVEHLKRYMYSISTCAHVLSSMYVSQVWVQWYPVSGHGKHLTCTLKAVCLCCFCFVHACL